MFFLYYRYLTYFIFVKYNIDRGVSISKTMSASTGSTALLYLNQSKLRRVGELSVFPLFLLSPKISLGTTSRFSFSRNSPRQEKK